jgi:hypothetical protein
VRVSLASEAEIWPGHKTYQGRSSASSEGLLCGARQQNTVRNSWLHVKICMERDYPLSWKGKEATLPAERIFRGEYPATVTLHLSRAAQLRRCFRDRQLNHDFEACGKKVRDAYYSPMQTGRFRGDSNAKSISSCRIRVSRFISNALHNAPQLSKSDRVANDAVHRQRTAPAHTHTNPYRRFTFPDADRKLRHVPSNKDVRPVGVPCVLKVTNLHIRPFPQ